PTSRALSIIGSHQLVMRETPETTSVVTRLAPSFVRFGSFEHWFYNKNYVTLKVLADYVIETFFPELAGAENRYHAFLAEVTRRTAHLMANWQSVGFMHGVMNTDNMSVLGLTLDYGPFGFMEGYDPHHICNHTDQQGRYAYNRQPQIGHWNCVALGQTLLPLIGSVGATEDALKNYQAQYAEKMDQLLHAKLGLRTHQESDNKLFSAMFTLMQGSHTDFTLFFRRLGDLQCAHPENDAPLRNLFIDRAGFDGWTQKYRTRLLSENSLDQNRRLAMHAINPKYVLRNYLAQIAIEKAQKNEYCEVRKLRKILESPFDEQPEHAHYAELPPGWADKLEVSCSS
ncbi:MAG: YdiU family protein, partial [Glaciimonas sp.]|nr:YdiU family protein [Glaciimonas sp.]